MSKYHNPRIVCDDAVWRHIHSSLSITLKVSSTPTRVLLKNACNMSRSTELRVSWINDKCVVVCVRFHYKSHKCNIMHNPHSYSSCQNYSTSGAESTNSLRNMSKTHVRFLSVENMIPFLAAKVVFMNIREKLWETTKNLEINMSRFREFIKEQWKCSCHRFSRFYQEILDHLEKF